MELVYSIAGGGYSCSITYTPLALALEKKKERGVCVANNTDHPHMNHTSNVSGLVET